MSVHFTYYVPIVVIDEAHLLSPSMLQEIRFLTNFKQESFIALSITELRDKLCLRSLEAISQRITTRYHLTGLVFGEMKKYIMHQLAIVGENKQIFSEAALNRIFKQTRGILRLTNRLCTECLIDIVSRKQQVVDEDVVERMIEDQYL